MTTDFNNIEILAKKKMYEALSGDKIMRLSECNKLFIYKQISSLTNYNELFDNNGKCLILFETKKNYGHWICIIKNNNKKTIYFFDSYGTFPDDELKYVPKNFKKESKQDFAYLSNLLEQSMDDGYTVDYSDHNLQSENEKISTCGRWCGVRLLLYQLTNDEFFTNIENLSKESQFHDLDFLISLLTINF